MPSVVKKYPEDIRDASDYVQFQFFKYETPIQGNNSGTTYSQYQSDYGTLTQESSIPTVVLNMPNDINTSFTGAWSGKETTSLAQAALGQIVGLGKAVESGDFQKLSQTSLLQNPGDATKGILKAFGDDGIKFLADQFAKLPGLGANLGYNDVIQLTAGVILNPNTELLYGGLGLRPHAYSFKLIPRSRNEAKEIIDIVKAFKVACLPDPKGAIFGTKGNNFLSLPSLCKVSFLRKGVSGDNPYLPKYKMSGIQSVNINYVTDGNYMSFEDGYPVGIQLTVSLVETKLVFRNDVEQGNYR